MSSYSGDLIKDQGLSTYRSGAYSGDLIKSQENPTIKSGSYSLGNEIVKSELVDYIVVLTESEYNAISSPDPKVLYCIVED